MKKPKPIVLDSAFQKKLKKLLPKEMEDSISFLYEIATKDQKTGVYNNNFFNTIFDMELEKTSRGDTNLCLMMIDIDSFRQINEIHGHIKADELLYKFAQTLQKKIRKSDIFARFGGDEFVLLLPKTTLLQAKKLSKRLQIAIQENKVLQKYNVHFSGGLTKFKKGETKSSFFKRTNKALKKAKKEGKNQFKTE